MDTKLKKLNAFFEAFGVIEFPGCFVCKTKVESFGFNMNEKNNTIVGTVKCHNKSEHYSFDFDKLMKMTKKSVSSPDKKRLNKIVISDAFKSKGRLEEGKVWIE